MHNPAPTDHEIHELLRKRYSPRAFSAKPVEDGELRSLLEAARWAASCFNEQPWRFIVARRKDAGEFERLLSCINEKNQKWAQHAAVLMLSVARSRFGHNGKPNRHALHDVGQASAQLTLQAMSLGLGVHQMAGFSGERARELYGIPEDFEPVAAIAIGYFEDPEDPPEPLRQPELGARSRKPQAHFAFGPRWGEPLGGGEADERGA